MKNIFYILYGSLCFCCGSCTHAAAPRLTVDQIELIKALKKMSPDAEFLRNIAAHKTVFYAVGSQSYGCNASGLSEADVHEYISKRKIPVELRFTDDPAPIGASDEYWAEAEKFVESYNKMVVNYLKTKPSGSGLNNSDR